MFRYIGLASNVIAIVRLTQSVTPDSTILYSIAIAIYINSPYINSVLANLFPRLRFCGNGKYKHGKNRNVRVERGIPR